MKGNSQTQNNFYWLYLIGIFLILALPLLSIPPTFHPPAWAKSILFRIIFSSLIFLFIWEILGRKDKLKVFWQKIRRSAAALPCWLLIALFAVFFLATIFSLDPSFSFWGSPYRGGGFLTFGFCILFAIFLFLILRKRDWQKILDFTLIIGSLAALFAIFQKLGWFGEYIVTYEWRPMSTMGGPIFLALYLVLFSFLPLAFGIIAKGKKKIFYFSCFVLVLIGIILAATRAILLGLGVGFLFFIFLYPVEEFRKDFSKEKSNLQGNSKFLYGASLARSIFSKKIVWLKVLAGVFLILGILGTFWLRGQPQLVETLKENKFFGAAFDRTWQGIGEGPIIEYIARSRAGGWKVLFEAVKDRPILGYGPENLSIAFDKHYDPTLPGITRQPGGGGSTSWWDRGHNFIFDVSVSAGIPALIIYLLLFGALFWRLQKVKYTKQHETEHKKTQIVAHGMQATFIGYLVANFFSFDVAATYLVLFLLIGYSLHLISSNQKDAEEFNVIQRNNQRPPAGEAGKISGQSEVKPWKYVFLAALACCLIWFIWSANIKPLQVNKEINMAVFFKQNNRCDKAIEKMEEIMPQRSFIDNYLRLQYTDIITECLKKHPQNKLALSSRVVKILGECTELRPYYTRSWLYLAVYANKIIESDSNLTSEQKQELNEKVQSWLEKAHQLSPKRSDIFITWIKNNLINRNYQEAKQKAEQCIEYAPENGDCWWGKALALSGLNELEEASECMEIAASKGYQIEAVNALNQLVKLYSNLAKDTNEIKYYEALVGFYQKLIKLDYNNFQYHASLAYAYKMVGEYDKAREEAMIVMELSPESRQNVEEFLKTLPD